MQKRAEEFNVSYTFLSDSQDLDALCDAIPAIKDPEVWRFDLTGAMVKVGEGGYTEAWATESARPYSILAEYTQIIGGNMNIGHWFNPCDYSVDELPRRILDELESWDPALASRLRIARPLMVPAPRLTTP